MKSNGRRVDIGELAFRLWESPRPIGSDLPSVILVHGIGMSHRYLMRLHDLLAVSTRVVSIDLPGFGGLPKPLHDVDVPEMGRALAATVASLGEERIVLVGHSMGAQWVAEAAADPIIPVAAVVAIGPVVDERNRTLGAQARALAVDTLGETPRTNAIVFGDYIRCGIRWYLMQVRHMLAHRTEDAYRALTVPVLVIRGGADPVAGREWSRRLRDAARISRLVEVPRRHHVVQESAPRAVASAVLLHISGAWPDDDAVRTVNGEQGSATSSL